MKKAKYIVIEGTEGVGKTTQVGLLAKKLREKHFNVLETREPGSPHNELTMHLRGIMLDASYNLPRPARELISQAIRSIHLSRVVQPELEKADYIIQDRGILSAVSYGEACGNDVKTLKDLCTFAISDIEGKTISTVYDKIIVLLGDSRKNLIRATQSKQEFKAGDVMEMKGPAFIEKVKQNFLKFGPQLGNVSFIYVDGKSIDEVSTEILAEIAKEPKASFFARFFNKIKMFFCR